MLRVISFGLTCLIMGTSALAVDVVETFNYSTGNIGAQSSTATNGNKWGAYYYFGLGGSGNHNVVAGSLTAPTGYGYAPSHNALQHGSTNGDSLMDFDDAANIDFGVNSTFYMSFLMNMPNATTQNGAGAWVGVFSDAGGISGSPSFAIGEDNDDGATFGHLTIVSGGGKTKVAKTFTNGVDTLVVVKITTVASGSDIVEASIFPSTGAMTAEPTAWDITRAAPITITGKGLWFSSYNSAVIFDEVRLGDSYAAVTAYSPVPEPASLVLFSVGLVAWLRRRAA